MSNEQEFLRGLANFTELLRRDDFNSNVSKQSDPIDLMPNGTNSLECEFDLQSNEKIIKAFKEIRGQLRDTNKANQALREELNSTKLQLKQLSES